MGSITYWIPVSDHFPYYSRILHSDPLPEELQKQLEAEIKDAIAQNCDGLDRDSIRIEIEPWDWREKGWWFRFLRHHNLDKKFRDDVWRLRPVANDERIRIDTPRRLSDEEINTCASKVREILDRSDASRPEEASHVALMMSHSLGFKGPDDDTWHGELLPSVVKVPLGNGEWRNVDFRVESEVERWKAEFRKNVPEENQTP
ncbi:hypothetical protein F4780DRAFT_63713 [Xylariomycetidae sp. FL0641]|nr:hypothetical protein F4780DRAFT_63713 [Xylariomycetidae sp. FL0641]